ncbi:hypothetical protein H8M03_09770 [Sphingomonas sabuli]|uniref:HTH luxR-type domain-containing protein n=1 Tax=Sphingomonas sabuli TaxID=2764186 RepID=A0A7G9L100_9SPHN|nr:LuxR C-terminal-related transcriptional regulator [Sphingomonas sabuli]QNM82299.1 hypothetical protein H8M03_09770 [Sphingomonas sabuli]
MGDLFDLIAALHEGIDTDEHWLAALDRLSDELGGAALFLGTTHRNGSGFELSGHRVEPQWIELVNGELAGHESNPIYAMISSQLRTDPAATIMKPIRLSDVLEPAAFRASPIYKRAIQPAGHEHAMAMVLSADAASALSLTLVRPDRAGDFRDDEMQLVRAVGPHIVAALKMRHQMSVAQSAAMMLDRYDHGILLLASSGNVVHANADAERLLAERDGLQVDRGHLRAAYPADTDALRQMISEADRAARAASLQPRAALRLRRPSGQDDLVLRALPAPPIVASTFGVGELATIALFIHDPKKASQSVDQVIADGFGLTAAEAATAARIWEGDSVSEAAATLGISANTVKTHLKAAFEKAGVDRQSALVRKIADLLRAVGHR